jgi:predicted lipoprotein with Yx(FWY)xxD motif
MRQAGFSSDELVRSSERRDSLTGSARRSRRIPTRGPATLFFALLACAGLAGCVSTAATASTYEVRSSSLPGLGRVLVDGQDFTLYVYLPDNRGPSRCTSVCASQWPPLLLPHGVRHPTAGAGVDAALLGTTRRANGTLQVTYNRWPLYTDLADAPGQVNGQGDGMGAWYVLSTNGTVDRQPSTS